MQRSLFLEEDKRLSNRKKFPGIRNSLPFVQTCGKLRKITTVFLDRNIPGKTNLPQKNNSILNKNIPEMLRKEVSRM